MRLRALIPSTARVKLLTLLILGSEGKYYVREIERRTGENINSVRRELANLETAGLVTCLRSANLKYYSINRNSPVYNELRSLLLKTEGAAALIGEKLAGHGGLNQAFIFGSFAKGDEGPSSDIDLFLVGDIDDRTVARNVREIEGFLGREVNYVVMSPKEYERRRRDRDPFLEKVLSSPRILLSGDEGDDA